MERREPSFIQMKFQWIACQPADFSLSGKRKKKYSGNQTRSAYVYLIPRFWCIVSTFSSKQVKKKKFSRYLTRALSLLPMNHTLLPPSLPPTRGELAGPILQYLYFSMLKPRYTINYINKLRFSIFF